MLFRAVPLSVPGEELPTKLSNRFDQTDFEFKPRGAAGADVKVTGGMHPSEYPDSFWEEGNDYGDFKPDNNSGWNRFDQEVNSGKLPENTQMLPYDDQTGEPTWDSARGDD